jgi:hypothetical protein
LFHFYCLESLSEFAGYFIPQFAKETTARKKSAAGNGNAFFLFRFESAEIRRSYSTVEEKTKSRITEKEKVLAGKPLKFEMPGSTVSGEQFSIRVIRG